MMQAQAINEIERLVTENHVIEHEGQKFVPKGYKPLRWIDRPQAIYISTLKSFAKIADTISPSEQSKHIIVVSDDFTVRLYGPEHKDDRLRGVIAEARFSYDPYPFNGFVLSEEFAILLQTRFVMTEEAQKLIHTVSKLHIEDGVELADNGMAQKITVKRGISSASLASEVVPNFVKLAPYRIFPECDQIETIFLVRLTGDKESGARVGLFEADGDIWKVRAKEVIHKKLKDLISVNHAIPIYC